MEKSNKVIDITGEVMHDLAYDFNVTLREINKEVGDEVYAIVSYLSNKY